MNDTFFFDTYAIFEIIAGNTKYARYTSSRPITTIFNLAELNRNLRKEIGKKIADEYTEKYSEFLVDVTIDDVKNAIDIKTTYKNLSIPDSIGYTVAKRLGVKFLTGDNDFKDMVNVEFVKKD